MSELAGPLSQEARARARHDRLVRLHAEADRVALLIRQETAALVEQDTSFGVRSFVPDELSLSLAESPGTCRRRVEDAVLTVAHPRLMQLVQDSIDGVLTGADKVHGRTFGIRHLDAVLDELVGASEQLQGEVLDLVLADEAVRTPHELRKAVRAARLLHDLDDDRSRADRIHAGRGVTLVDERDGSATLMAGGLKHHGSEMLAALDAQPGVGVAWPGDERSLGQRRYDFLRALLCGTEQVTAPWQALIVVSLSTLEGGQEPAEIPGLGLVSAEEAREVLAKADLRRAVVDARGQLVSLDDVVHRGELQPLRGPVPATVDLPEPEPVIDADPQATEAERAWLAEQDEEIRESQEQAVRALFQDGMDQIERVLRDELLVQVRAGDFVTGSAHDPRTRRKDRPALLPDLCRAHGSGPQGPDDGGPPDRPGPVRPGGDGRGTPHDGPPSLDDPDPGPSGADLDWQQRHDDAAVAYEQIDRRAHATAGFVLRPPAAMTPCPSLRDAQRRWQRLDRHARQSRWTTAGLAAAVTRLRTAPLTPVPAASRGYLFRGRLARWIRTRDVTCTFPGCARLAQRCELDHVLRHPYGPTDACNGACECVHHHQCKHAAMTVTRTPDGTMLWTTRFGLTTARPPRPLLRGW